MTANSVTPGSGVILLSTLWNQSGKIKLADGTYADITYNEYCPLDSNTGARSVTGCTNTAASQILYYWIERGLLKLNLTLNADDGYTSSYRGSTVNIDATAETAAANGYLAFSEVNSHLSDFTVNNAEDIAALNFACGVIQQSGYSSNGTGTAWDSNLFLRAGMAGCTDVCTYDESDNSNPYFFDYSSGSRRITDAGYEVIIDELLSGRVVGASSFALGHALVFDGYNADNDTFHINYGWGGLDNGWYTKEEIDENNYYEFLIDLMPSYDGNPILVTNSASYGAGTFLRGLEQLQGITAADTLTVQEGVAGSRMELQKFFHFDKAITLNNLNSDLLFSETSYIFDSTADITINGLSGRLSNEFDNYSVYAVKTSQNLTVNDLSGVVSVSGDYSTAFSAQNLTINGMKGLLNVCSKSSSASVLSASETLNAVNLAGTVIAANSSSYSQYTFAGNSINLQNFCGICISAAVSRYSACAVNVSGGTLDMSLNNGRIHAGKYTSQSAIAALQEDLSLIGAAGTAAAIKYNGNVLSNFYAAEGSTQDDVILLKNYSILQGGIFLGGGSDTLSVLGGSYVYAPSVSSVEQLTIDSTSTLCGLFYGDDESLTLDMIITAETPSEEMICVLSNAYNFTSCLKDQVLHIDLRGAKDGEYVLVNAAGTSYAYSLSSLSAEISTGSGIFTLQCGESANHVSLKYEEEKLILVLDDYAAQATGALLFDGDTLKSVSDSVSGLTLSGDDTDSLRLTDGGAAENITVNEGGDLSVSGGGTATGTVVNAYGILAVNAGGKAVNTTVNADGILNLASSGTLAGSLTIEDEAEVKAAANSTIDFTLDGFTASTYSGINNISRITGTPAYTLTVSQTQSAGKYILAGNAADFASTITVCGLAEEYSLNLSDSQSFQDAGKKYSLVCENSCLALEITVSSKPEVDIEWFWYIDGGRLNVSAETGYTVSYALTENPENWINYTEPLELIQGTYYFKAENSSGIARTQIKGYLHQSNTSGGAIANSGTQTLNNTYFAGNTAASADEQHGYFSDSRERWLNASADVRGGAIFNNGMLTLSNAVFSGNTGSAKAEATGNTYGMLHISAAANMRGGAICNSSSMDLTNTVFRENCIDAIAYASGSARSSSAKVSGVATAYAQGGAIYNDGTMTLSGASFCGNAAHASATAQSRVSGGARGGAIYNAGNMSLSEASFSGNQAGSGGAIYNTGSMTLSNVRFETASDTIYNGGTMTFAGVITLAGNLFTENAITADGAEIVLDISACTEKNNTGIITGIDHITGVSAWSITISENQAVNAYKLAAGNKDTLYGMTFSIKNTSGTILADSLTANAQPVNIGSQSYWLEVVNDAELFLECSSKTVSEIAWQWSINEQGQLEVSAEDGYSLKYGTNALTENTYSEALELINGTYYFRAESAEQFARNQITGYKDSKNHFYSGTQTCSNVYFAGNSVRYDGVLCNTGSLTCVSAAFFSNLNSHEGGAICNTGTMTLSRAQFRQNETLYQGGGAIFNTGSMNLTDTLFRQNTASDYFSLQLGGTIIACGGAILNSGGEMTLANAEFRENCASFGGAIFNSSGTITVADAVLQGNRSYSGGAFYNDSGSAFLSNVRFSGNMGGAIHNQGGTMTLADVRCETAYDTICNEGDMTLTGTITLAGTLSANQTITAAGAKIIMDLSSWTETNRWQPFISDMSKISGTPGYSLVIRTDQTHGMYDIAENAAGFQDSVSLTIGEQQTAVLSAGDFYYIGKTRYSLFLSDTSLHFSIEEDLTAPVITLSGENRELRRSVELSASTEAGVVIYYSTDNTNWKEYTGVITVTQNDTYYFKATDGAGNTGYNQMSFNNIVAKPYDLNGNADNVRWEYVPDTEFYQIEYSQDGFEHTIAIKTAYEGLNTFALPQGSYAWRVRADEGSWVSGDVIISQGSSSPRYIYAGGSCSGGNLLFANASGIWESSYLAQHLGFGSWEGTGEYAAIAGKNILADFFVGSEDANLLLLTDSENGDALFMDDIYTALPANVQNQSRIQDIREIRAGAGADVIDLTSQQFSYTGEGMTIRGGDGDDTVWANKGENKLFGDAGNDRLAGGTGNDVIAGGAGNDSMLGGGGNDIFVFCSDWGKDTVEQIAGGSVTLWFVSDSGTWDQSTFTYTGGENSVTVTGVSDVTLKFGDDGSEEYDTLVSCGAFMASSTEKIFEEEGKGTVAVL